MKKKMNYLIVLLTIIFLVGCTNIENASVTGKERDTQEVTTVETNSNNSEKEKTITTAVDQPVVEETPTEQNNDLFSGYKLIEVDGGDLSGHREPNVVVDIAFGDDRKYFSFTNEFGQVIRVIADETILQDDRTEPVTSSGRYYSDEAKVPGVESADLDDAISLLIH